MRPLAVPPHIRLHLQPKEKLNLRLAAIRARLLRLQAAVPDVSVVIPAFNEEDRILQTLSSLSASDTGRSVEIIVMDNNSTDATGPLAAAAGATVITAPVQGITPARNAGLQAARGKFVLNADADTLYPPRWIELMVQPLVDGQTALVYGNFAFLPPPGTSRLTYAGYEWVAGLSRWLNKRFRDEAVNVYGFNSAFRREEGMQAGGFDHPPGSNEDGWLALKLRNTLGKPLYRQQDPNALVWTTARRIEADGGILKAMYRRLKRQMGVR